MSPKFPRGNPLAAREWGNVSPGKLRRFTLRARPYAPEQVTFAHSEPQLIEYGEETRRNNATLLNILYLSKFPRGNIAVADAPTDTCLHPTAATPPPLRARSIQIELLQ